MLTEISTNGAALPGNVAAYKAKLVKSHEPFPWILWSLQPWEFCPEWVSLEVSHPDFSKGKVSRLESDPICFLSKVDKIRLCFPLLSSQHKAGFIYEFNLIKYINKLI